MIILTGAAGFIGSHVAKHFQEEHALLLVDKPQHFRDRQYMDPNKISLEDWSHGIEHQSKHRVVDREYFPKLLEKLEVKSTKATESILPAGESIEYVVHIGACTDTSAERDPDFLKKWNVDYTKSIWHWCAKHQVPLIYASSAATYGGEQKEFSDTHDTTARYEPLNPYALSKHEFDLWALDQVEQGESVPPKWYGLKFFNVYGEQESHKGSMASPILHSFRYFKEHGRCRLFRSARADVKDGEQSRDFINVKDIVQIIDFIRKKEPAAGLYNCGTGRARTFYEMMQALCSAMDSELAIDWIDTPEKYRKAYQYYTQADMRKLREAGYDRDFIGLEQGVADYVKWLQQNDT